MQAAVGGGSSATAKREAVEFLRDRLSGGRVKTADVEEEAEAHGISKSALKRARKELGVRPWKDKKLQGDWYLELPPAPRAQVLDD